MSYNTELQDNNAELEELLEMANSLPDAVAGSFIVTATEGDGEVTGVSATFAAMYAACQSGKHLILIILSPYTDSASLLQCDYVSPDNIIFSALSTATGDNIVYSVNIFSDDTNVYLSNEVGGVDEETLNAAVESALTEAKESGEFDGADGERGTGILNITTAPSSYTTATGGFTPVYRIDLSTVRTQSGVSSVFVGDQLRYSYYLYPVGYVDSSYVYLGTRVSLRGSTGASSEWYAGTGITGTSTTDTIFSGSGISAATVGDMYLNTSTYNTYRCTTAGAASAAKWVYVCNIKGDAYTLTDADKNDIADSIATGLTLGVHTDGLAYIFKDGVPIGNGIEVGSGGDISCYVDSENNIILKENREGALPDGTYTAYVVMEDGSKVAIGELTKDTNVYYSVTNTLTNCKNSNSATQVVEGGSYSATITANDGYELKTVTVTMSGANVSVSGGVINIASVTGDIVITAVAEEVQTSGYTNLIPTLTDVDLTTIYNGKGYKENTRISRSAVSTSNPTGEITQADTTLLGLLPLGNDGDVLHLRGAKFRDVDVGDYDGIIWSYDSNGALLGSGTPSVQSLGLTQGTDANGDCTLTLAHSKMNLPSGTAYLRFNISNTAGELIMTRNELITGNETAGNDTIELVNQIPLSTDASGNLFNGGQGWKTGYRLSSSSGNESASSGTEVTGFMPIRYGQTIQIENVSAVTGGTCCLCLYGSDFAFIKGTYLTQFMTGTTSGSPTMDGTSISRELNSNTVADITEDSGIAYFRFSATDITNNSIVYVY